MYTIAITETTNPDAARYIRSTLRNWHAERVGHNTYRVQMSRAQRITLAQVAAMVGAEVRYLDAAPAIRPRVREPVLVPA